MEYNYELLLKLTRGTPHGLDKEVKPAPISDELKKEIYERDQCCKLCGRKGENIHHIIPNGETTPENLVLLCRRCHVVVHEILSITKKWKNVTYAFRNKEVQQSWRMGQW